MLCRAEKFLVNFSASVVNFWVIVVNFPGLLRLPELPWVTVEVS